MTPFSTKTTGSIARRARRSISMSVKTAEKARYDFSNRPFDIERFQNLNDPVVDLCFFDVRGNNRRETVNNDTPFVHVSTVVSSEFLQRRDEIFDCSQPDVNSLAASGCPGSMRSLRGRSKCLSIFCWLNCDTRNLRGDYHTLGFNQQKSKLSPVETQNSSVRWHRQQHFTVITENGAFKLRVQASQWYTHANCPELSWQQPAFHDWEITRGNNTQISTVTNTNCQSVLQKYFRPATSHL